MAALSEQREAIFAEIGRLTMAASSVDNHLTTILARLISPTQDSYDTALASIIVFTAKSIDQRFELVRKVMRWRLATALSQPRHMNVRRAADFAEKALNAIEKEIRSHRWARNTAAHGDILHHEGRVTLTPAMLDYETWKNIRSKGDEYRFGLSISHLESATSVAAADNANLTALTLVIARILDWTDNPKELLDLANSLAQSLKIERLSLRDPREGRPMRQRRKGRDDS